MWFKGAGTDPRVVQIASRRKRWRSRLPTMSRVGILAGLEGLRMNVLRASLMSVVAVMAAISVYGCSSSDNNGGGGGGGDGGGGGGGGGGCTGDGCIAVSVSIEEDHSCAVMKDGTARCWGPGYHGGRGRGPNDTTDYAPKPVVQLTNAASIFVNDDNSCAFLRDGTVSCWGFGDTYGNGTGAPTGGQGETEVPKSVGLTGAISLVGNISTTCALLQAGTVSCWQLVDQLQPAGTPPADPALSPVQIQGLSGAKEIAVGNGPHLCVIYAADATGGVSCIGGNQEGQLGYDSTTTPNGNVSASQTFNSVVDTSGSGKLANVAHVRAGGTGTCAILNDGTLVCWGSNSTNPDTNSPARYTPTKVGNLSGVVDVAVGDHSCAVLQDGTVWCWGTNNHGELGDGTTKDSTVPVQVAGVTNAKSVAVGTETSCIIQNDGRVACWGANGNHDFGTVSNDSSVQHPIVVPF